VPAVSVIIPVFNRERYLREALESARAQTRPAEEIIVVDDGSTDDSAEVARSFGGNVRCLTQANQGCGPARNSGIAAARGELIAFLDSDDLWLPTKLERQIAELVTRPEVDLVFCRMVAFLSSEIDEREMPRPDPREVDACLASGLLMRRRVFETVGPFHNVPTVEMIDWMVRVRDQGFREAVVPEVLLHRRSHPGNMVREKNAPGDYLRLLKRRLDRRRTAVE
jgi:glycosyltransferase involved in cell wall biosynthesis